jgi:hypothetical protein
MADSINYTFEELEAALIELHEFIYNELDDYPVWAHYYTEPRSALIAQILQDRASRG